jgi:hypothetical protein
MQPFGSIDHKGHKGHEGGWKVGEKMDGAHISLWEAGGAQPTGCM